MSPTYIVHREVYGAPRENCIPSMRILRVCVARASSIMKKDIFGTCDPYCKIGIFRVSRQNLAVGLPVRTKTIKRCLNPVWNEEFFFRVNPENYRIIFELFDENRITRDDFLGVVSIHLSQLDIETEAIDSRMPTKSFLLRPRSPRSRVQGKLLLSLSYLPPSVDIRIPFLPDNSSDRVSISEVQESAAHLPTSAIETLTDASGPSTPSSEPPRQSDLLMSLVLENEPLPEGWDEWTDQNGRTYYVDHVNRRTQWDRPISSLPEGWEQRTDVSGRVYYVDHLNQRTTWYSPLSMENDSWQSITNLPSNGIGFSSPQDGTSEAAMSALPGLGECLRRGQPCYGSPSNFIYPMRSPEEEVQEAQTMYLRRHMVRPEDTISRSLNSSPSFIPEPPEEMIRSEVDSAPADGEVVSTGVAGGIVRPSIEDGFESSTLISPSQALTMESPDRENVQGFAGTSQLISVFSSSADTDNPLPSGWQMAISSSGRPFFINHNDRTTTWDDPRTAENPPSILTSAAQRHILPALGQLPPGWEERVHNSGRIFYINHNARSTQWEDPRLEKLGGPALPYSRNYRRKYDYFRSRLKPPRDPQAKFEMRITRQGILEDSFRLIYPVKKPEILMHRLWIEFIGEKGLDYGGVQREWFFLLSRGIFNPYYGLFEYSAADNYTLQINPLSGLANEDHLRYFKFIGRVCGMAVYHGKLVDGFFIRPFYKMMLGKKITLTDMQSVDSEYYRSLKYLLETDPKDLGINFSLVEEHFGETVEVNLMPGGSSIPVTNANKREYIERVINWRFVSRVEHQMCAFLEGFSDLVPLETLQIFDANELELLMCGLQDISVSDWKSNTLYKGEYHANHPVIINFWKAIYTFTNELRSRLLQFVTGTSRVPMNGFAELWGSTGIQKFTIEPWGDTDQLPRAHTCFNKLDLPPYLIFEELRCKMIVAIENTEGFEGVD